jgi:hypothetical protein
VQSWLLGASKGCTTNTFLAAAGTDSVELVIYLDLPCRVHQCAPPSLSHPIPSHPVRVRARASGTDSAIHRTIRPCTTQEPNWNGVWRVTQAVADGGTRAVRHIGAVKDDGQGWTLYQHHTDHIG